LVSQNAMRMCHTVLCGLALKTFSTLSNKRYDFRKKVIEHKTYVLIFSTSSSETFFILRTTEQDMVNVHTPSCSVGLPVTVRFYWNFNFLDRFSKNNQTSNFIKIHPVGVQLFYLDKQTDCDEADSCLL
jgi:hypothetical protein